MNTATNKISANSLQLHEISADSLLSRYGKSVLAATAISTASTYSIEQSGDWGNTLNLRLYPASVVNVEKINPQIDYDKDLPHNNEKKNRRKEDNTMDKTGRFTAKDYIDARQNAYEKSVDGRISVYEKSIDERIVRIEKSNDDLRKEINAFVQEIKKDNSSTRRAVWSSLVGGAITLGGIFVTSFFAIPSVMDFGSKIKDVVNIEVTKQNAETNKRFAGIETRMDGLETRMNGLEKRMDSVETKLDKLIEIATDKQ